MNTSLGLADLINNVDWNTLNNATKEIQTQKDGWLQIRGKNINIVDEIEKISGLKYHYSKYEDAWYNIKHIVRVNDDVGNLIELYIKSEAYADLDLSEFLTKSLAE